VSLIFKTKSPGAIEEIENETFHLKKKIFYFFIFFLCLQRWLYALNGKAALEKFTKTSKKEKKAKANLSKRYQDNSLRFILIGFRLICWRSRLLPINYLKVTTGVP